MQRDDAKRGTKAGGGEGGRAGSVADGSSSAAADGMDYSVYGRFTALIAPRETVKPKARPLSWLMRLIEEIYDQRYAKDTADLRGEAEAGGAEDGSGGAGGAASTPFPQFVVDFFSKRYGLRSLIDQTCWDLLYNLALARREHLEAETFARFLESYYDADDLLFYLYVRSVAQKELNVSFRTRWSELGRAGADGGVPNSGAPAPLFLSVRECAVVSRVVFGSEADPLFRTFMAMLERHLTGARRGRADGRRIEVPQFLHLALVEYHETRPADEEGGAGTAGRAGGYEPAAAGGAYGGRSGAGSQAGSPAGAAPGSGERSRPGYGGYEGGHSAPGLGYDDLAAAGLSGGGSPAGGGGGAGASPSASERLFREAEASYDGRYTASAGASAAAPGAGGVAASAAAPAGTAAGSGGASNTAAALLRRSPHFFDDLGEGMHRANEAYLDRALGAAAGLPGEVQAQIRAEVQAQLEGKLDGILASTIKATQAGTGTGVAARDSLVAHFGRVMAAAAGDASAASAPDASIPAFCDAVLAQQEVQETVAPLVSLLVTYATARLQEAAAGGSS